MASQLLPLGEACLECAKFDTGEEANSELEFSGTLVGFDDYVNMVLEDVTEFDYSGTHTKLPKILLNGNNICMLIPGGEGPA
ncbi:putative U6 snRNA-associated protein [Metarhizium acridum CQMa 102]|uniref:LSM complex subunit LSM5 n=1 Tax=Metarhizium acridum (strain CQMa 102) TaxID=655827 RepID=E9E7T3_METAQ|nr:putative U6 snRNA-associated protein [Metarhizium acridum CQMa 102]EFY88067.1 putative U6 snRNA-associated protein [Metarhizium acridum CQMa 102]